jgi:mycothiol synthase
LYLALRFTFYTSPLEIAVTTVITSARPYAGEADLPLIAELINSCEMIDRLDDATSADELRLEFSTPGFDAARDLRLWQADDGQLIGFGQLWFHDQAADPDSFVWYKIHPSARGGDLDMQILAWAAGRTREVARERGVRLRLRAVAYPTEPERIALLESEGFGVDRYFWRMACPLDDSIPEPRFPDSFTLISGPHDPEAWVQLFNESFVDHWNHVPKTAEEARHWQSDALYRPELNLVALAPDGTPAAFCWCEISAEQNALSERNEGHIGLLGTRRGFRSIGLGRAMLLAGMRVLRDAGADTAKLGVDADSPTGATRLYESAGFRTVMTRMLYGKDG